MINQRLFDWYGIDTGKHLDIKKYCPRPYDTVLIDKQGSCYLCECTAWLPQSAGNLHVRSLADIVNSDTAKTIKNTIKNNSYRLCNNQQCSYLKAPKGNTLFSTTLPQSKIKHIRLAIDDSCNLSCPSCRKHMIFDKDKSSLTKKFHLADRILQFVRTQSHQINLHVGSDGDPFASIVYRYFIKKAKDLPNVKFTIQTNGLLIKKMYHRHQQMFDKLDILNISIDGATKNTYEKLRRGGKFFKIVENLNFVKRINKKFKVHLHMVVQQENWQEMPAMLKIARQINADTLFFNRIQNWNTDVNFDKQTFTSDKNFKNLLEQMKQDDLTIVAGLF